MRRKAKRHATDKPQRRTRDVVALVVSGVSAVIALASLGVAYAAFKNSEEFNSFQTTQGRPVFSFARINNQESSGWGVTRLNDGTSNFCDKFRFEIKNVSDHPASKLTIENEIYWSDSTYSVHGAKFVDVMDNLAIAKDESIGTRYNDFCFILRNITDTPRQDGYLYWHGIITSTDLLTGESYTQNVYIYITLHYDTAKNEWTHTYFFTDPSDFQKIAKAATTMKDWGRR